MILVSSLFPSFDFYLLFFIYLVFQPEHSVSGQVLSLLPLLFPSLLFLFSLFYLIFGRRTGVSLHVLQAGLVVMRIRVGMYIVLRHSLELFVAELAVESSQCC